MSASDGLDRVMDQLEQTIEELPPPAIGIVLCSWRARVSEIRSQLDFVGGGGPLCPAAREVSVLEKAVRQIEAACAVDSGNGLRGFKKMMEDTR